MSLKIAKEPTPVVIFTRNHRVEGEIYMLSDSRLTDELNARVRSFIPVTNARIYSLTGDSLLYQADFVTLNKNAIDIVISSYESGDNIR